MRALAICALLAGVSLGGCASWEDEAGAEALAVCEKKADPEERAQCREMVVAAVKGQHQKQLDELQQSIDAAEDREQLRKVYGGPGQVDK